MHYLTFPFALVPQENDLRAIALVGAGIAFLIGLLQYRKAQHWKRSEWVALEMERFFADSRVRAGLQMIDWGARQIELYPDRETLEERLVVVSDDEIAEALKGHDERPAYTLKEVAIRDTFDHLLDRLERIDAFVEAKLISTADVRPYLRYWAYHVTLAREDESGNNRLIQLRKFILCYDYSGVQHLFRSLTRPTGLERIGIA